MRRGRNGLFGRGGRSGRNPDLFPGAPREEDVEEKKTDFLFIVSPIGLSDK